ncbi:hypothetical protein MDA_GLEAN10003173 [Myotis davidii]|uniref:Uncharacterized protein n=1 Tax=Myotis davidii TaxID=225400 RepID=L5M3X9_MYODS|nr:hypothetical protein MDA_GLEAN10003173 [Myotis davidii]
MHPAVACTTSRLSAGPSSLEYSPPKLAVWQPLHHAHCRWHQQRCWVYARLLCDFAVMRFYHTRKIAHSRPYTQYDSAKSRIFNAYVKKYTVTRIYHTRKIAHSRPYTQYDSAKSRIFNAYVKKYTVTRIYHTRKIAHSRPYTQYDSAKSRIFNAYVKKYTVTRIYHTRKIAHSQPYTQNGIAIRAFALSYWVYGRLCAILRVW